MIISDPTLINFWENSSPYVNSIPYVNLRDKSRSGEMLLQYVIRTVKGHKRIITVEVKKRGLAYKITM